MGSLWNVLLIAVLATFCGRAVADTCSEATQDELVAKIVDDFGLTEVHDSQNVPYQTLYSQANGEAVGQLRVWQGADVKKLVALSVRFPDPPMSAHLVVAFRARDSKMPHFLFDLVETPKNLSFLVDLLPKSDLAADLATVRRLYAGLEPAFLRADQNPDFTQNALPPLFKVFLSPFKIAKTTDSVRCQAAKATIHSYYEYWSSQELEARSAPQTAVRDRYVRRQLFSPEIDPAWGAVDSLVGKDVGASLRAQFQ